MARSLRGKQMSGATGTVSRSSRMGDGNRAMGIPGRAGLPMSHTGETPVPISTQVLSGALITYPRETAAFAYGPLGERVSKTEGDETLYYWRDGVRVILEGTFAGQDWTRTALQSRRHAGHSGSPERAARYTLAGASYYDPLISMRRGDTTSYYLYDQIGSTRKLINSNETVTDTYVYEAFGNLKSSTGSTTNPYQFVGSLGYHKDSTSGLLHVGARYYRPTEGRFLTTDPAVAGHPYTYASNGPSEFVDPSGLWCRHLPGHRCIGWGCHGDPYCKAKRRPPRKPPPGPGPGPFPPPISPLPPLVDALVGACDASVGRAVAVGLAHKHLVDMAPGCDDTCRMHGNNSDECLACREAERRLEELKCRAYNQLMGHWNEPGEPGSEPPPDW